MIPKPSPSLEEIEDELASLAAKHKAMQLVLKHLNQAQRHVMDTMRCSGPIAAAIGATTAEDDTTLDRIVRTKAAYRELKRAT